MNGPPLIMGDNFHAEMVCRCQGQGYILLISLPLIVLDVCNL